MNDTTLAPCPFCRGTARYLEEKTGFWTERAICDSCGFCLTRTHTESAVTRWNRRAPAPASGEPAAYRLKDDEATKHYGRDVYVYYSPSEFKTPAAFKYLEPLYTPPPVQEARVPLTSEQQRCIAEAHSVAACEEYFTARPQIDFTANRRIFEAGLSKGYAIAAAQKETP